MKQKMVIGLKRNTLAVALLCLTAIPSFGQDVATPSSPPATTSTPATSSAETAALLERLDRLEKYTEKLELEKLEKKEKEKSKPTAKLGGRIHVDTASFSQNDESEGVFDAQNASGIRRARIGVSGSYLEQFNYKLEVDFSKGSDIAMKDAYVEVVKLPILTGIRVGHFKEGFSLDYLTSSNTIWFLERSTIATALSSYVGDRNLGAAIGNGSAKKNWLWNVGVFANVSDSSVKYQFDDPHGYGLTARLSRLLWEDEENGSFFHLGTAYSFKAWDDSAMSFSAKPEQGFAPTVLKTASITGTDSLNALSAECIWTFRQFGLQSEFYYLGLSNESYDDPSVTGGYVQAGWWLTGDHYTYDKGRGSLGRTSPNQPFARRCDDGILFTSPGAWQLAYRFSWADFSDLPGEMSGLVMDHTIGLNWHLGSHARVMLDYISSNSDYQYGGNADTDGLVQIVAGRFQIDF